MIYRKTALCHSGKTAANHKDDYSDVSVAAEEAQSNKRDCWNKLACKVNCY